MPMDCLRSRDNVWYLSARNPAHLLPAAHSPAGPGSLATRLQSPGYPRQPSQWPGADQAAYYQGAPRYHGEHTLSYENKQFPYAASWQHGPRDSYHQAWQSYASPGTAYTSPWSSYGRQSVRTAPTWHQPSQPLPGHHCGARQQWDYTPTRPNWHGGSPQAQAFAWEHANGSDCGAPPTCLQQVTLPRPAVTRPPTRRQPRPFPGIDPIKVPLGSSDRPVRLRRTRAKGERSLPPTRHPSLALLLGCRGVRIAGHSSQGG